MILKGKPDVINIGIADIVLGNPILQEIKTYKDSIVLTKEDDTVTEEFSDQDEVPIAIFQMPGKLKINFSTFDYSNSVLLLLFGGTVLGDTWKPKKETNLEPQLIHIAIEMQNKVIEIHNAICKAKFNYNIKRDGVALIDIELTPVANEFINIFDLE